MRTPEWISQPGPIRVRPSRYTFGMDDRVGARPRRRRRRRSSPGSMSVTPAAISASLRAVLTIAAISASSRLAVDAADLGRVVEHHGLDRLRPALAEGAARGRSGSTRPGRCSCPARAGASNRPSRAKAQMPLLISVMRALLGRRVALLDDAARCAPSLADDAAVAEGAVDDAPSRGRGGARGRVVGDQASQRGRPQQRHVARRAARACPCGRARIGSACSTAWPVPSCGSWTAKPRSGSSARAARSVVGLVADDQVIVAGCSDRARPQ